MRKQKVEKIEKKTTKTKIDQFEKPDIKGKETFFVVDNTEYKTTLSNKYINKKPYLLKNPKQILAFMPGNIEDVCVKKSDIVKMGDKLLVLEAMKMKNEILAPFDGKIKLVLVKKDEKVTNNQLLIELQ